MCKVLERTVSSYVTYSRFLWILRDIHRRVGSLTKLLEIVIVITVGMQFLVGFGGSQIACLQEARRKVWVGRKKLKRSLMIRFPVTRKVHFS